MLIVLEPRLVDVAKQLGFPDYHIVNAIGILWRYLNSLGVFWSQIQRTWLLSSGYYWCSI